MSKKNNNSAHSMLNVIQDVVKQELQNKDQVALCQISSPGEDGNYNIYVVPDKTQVIHNIPNKFGFTLNTGDYVYVYKIGNKFATSFIFAKIDDNLDFQRRLELIERQGVNTGTSSSGIMLPGARGEKGDKGDPGPIGPTGPTGPTGLTGTS